MEVKLKPYGGVETSVDRDAESIMIWQKDDLVSPEDFVMLFNAKMARKLIKAIKKQAKELGWEV